MKVAKIHQADSPSQSSLNKEADEFVVVAMMQGSALHGMAETKTDEGASSISRLTAEMFKAVDHSTFEKRFIGGRLPHPVHLEAVGHPEAEREIVLRLLPRSTTTARVRFQDLGRAKPRIVLDDLLSDE